VSFGGGSEWAAACRLGEPVKVYMRDDGDWVGGRQEQVVCRAIAENLSRGEIRRRRLRRGQAGCREHYEIAVGGSR